MEKAQVVAKSETARHEMADLLASLNESQLTTPSLCVGWDVRTVAAHVIVATSTGVMGPMMAGLVKARGNLHQVNTTLARKMAKLPVPDLVTALHEQAPTGFAPPMVGPRGPLTDVIVHTADMRLPLGMDYDPDPEAVRMCLEFVTTGKPVGFVPKGRLRGLRLEATDLGWTHGGGAPVTGRGIDVLLAALGRTVVFPRLAGGGVDMLASRL